MANREGIAFTLVQIVLAAITILAALIYSLPIVCIRRFHHRNNIFTLNVCLTMMLCCVVYAFILVLSLLPGPSRHGRWLTVLKTEIEVSVVVSFVLVSVHRCCSIVYHRNKFFRSKQWVMACLAGEWILASIICVPFVVKSKSVRHASTGALLESNRSCDFRVRHRCGCSTTVS